MAAISFWNRNQKTRASTEASVVVGGAVGMVIVDLAQTDSARASVLLCHANLGRASSTHTDTRQPFSQR